MECFTNQAAYITLKDHKDNFHDKLPFCLVKPAKSEIGIVTKMYLERINDKVLKSTGVSQWRNSHTANDWFKSIPDKSKAKFIKFHITKFYPSINEFLLKSALIFAQT